MHNYAKQIGEHVKKCYCDFDKMNRAELCELGEWVDIMKDLAEFDVYIRKIEGMDMGEHHEKKEEFDLDEMVSHVKRLYMKADVAEKSAMKTEMMKLVQSM